MHNALALQSIYANLLSRIALTFIPPVVMMAHLISYCLQEVKALSSVLMEYHKVRAGDEELSFQVSLRAFKTLAPVCRWVCVCVWDVCVWWVGVYV